MDEKEIRHIKLEQDVSEVLISMVRDGHIGVTVNEVTGEEEYYVRVNPSGEVYDNERRRV